MTGEITLRGRVLPIGGLKEKILAAHRGRVKTVIIPAENRKDIHDIPSRVLKSMRLVLVDHMDQVIREAFADPELATRLGGERETLVYQEGRLVQPEPATDVNAPAG